MGAFLGSIFVAYFMGVKTGILTGPDQLERLGGIATLKAHTETDWEDIGRNLLFAGLGNTVGAVLFVACAYWFLYGRAAPGVAAETVPASRKAPAREPAAVPATAQG